MTGPATPKPSGIPRIQAALRALPWHMPALALLVFVLLLSLKPLEDPDLWSHLKAGQWMLETMSLPGADDPFTFPPSDGSEEALAGRRSQWLGQVAWYSAFRQWGALGVVGLRTALMMGPLVLLYILLVRKMQNPIGAFAAIALPALVLAVAFTPTFERPQAFSFALAVLLMALLLRLRHARAIWEYALLPLLMALWANLHGGYIVGLGLAAAFASGEALRFVIYRRRAGANVFSGERASRLSRPWVFFGACAIAVLAAGLSPAGFTHLAWLVDLADMGIRGASSGGRMGGLTEYRPMWFFLSGLHQPWPAFVAAYLAIFAALAAWALVIKRRWDLLPEVFAGLMTGVLCLMYVRLVPFAMLIVPFGAAAAVMSVEGFWRGAAALVLAAVMAVMGVYYAFERPWDIKPEMPSYWVRGEYPEAALEFMRQRKVEGPLFNPITWGGYIIWSAYPQYRPFIDGRLVSAEASAKYDIVIQASAGWEAALDSYGINAVLFPVISTANGAISPLLADMARHPEKGWRFVYLYGNTAVVVREGGPHAPDAHVPNSHVIACCAKPSREFFAKAADYADLVSMSMPNNPTVYLSKAIALQGAGRVEEARALLLKLPPGAIRDRLLRGL